MRESIWPLVSKATYFWLGKYSAYSGSFPNEHSRKAVSSCTYGCLHKTPFFTTPVQTPYFFIPVSGQLHLRTLFRVPRIVLRVSAYKNFHCIFFTLIIHTLETFQHGASGITRRSDKNQKFIRSIRCRPPTDTFAKKMRR